MERLLVLFCIVVSNYAVAQWGQTNGPTGGSTDEIIKLANYVFINGEAGGIFRSGDNGESWTAVNNGLPKYPHCYAFTRRT